MKLHRTTRLILSSLLFLGLCVSCAGKERITVVKQVSIRCPEKDPATSLPPCLGEEYQPWPGGETLPDVVLMWLHNAEQYEECAKIVQVYQKAIASSQDAIAFW